MTLLVAPKLLELQRNAARLELIAPSSGVMNKESQLRFTAVLLALLTLAASTLAWINFQKEREFQVPSDGVWWVERDGYLLAERVERGGPGARAGVKDGDRLTAVNSQEIKNTPSLIRQLYQSGPWSKAK